MSTLVTSSAPRGRGRRVMAPLAALVAGVAFAALAFYAGITAPGHPSPLVTTVHVLAGLIYVSIGSAAWLRRPNNATGALMTAAGLAWFIGDLWFVSSPAVVALAGLLNIAWFGFVGHLVMSFPSGRLETTADRILVALAYIWALASNALPEVLFASPATADLFALHRNAGQHGVAQTTQQYLNIALSLAVVVLVALHYRWATSPARRAMSPAFWASGPMLLAVVVLSVPGLAGSAPWLSNVLPVATPIALASLPIAFVVGLLRSRLAAAAVGHLVVELGRPHPADQLRRSLSRALHDP